MNCSTHLLLKRSQQWGKWKLQGCLLALWCPISLWLLFTYCLGHKKLEICPWCPWTQSNKSSYLSHIRHGKWAKDQNEKSDTLRKKIPSYRYMEITASALADPRGQAHPTRAPLRVPFLLFRHTNFSKRSHIGSRCPPYEVGAPLLRQILDPPLLCVPLL